VSVCDALHAYDGERGYTAKCGQQAGHLPLRLEAAGRQISQSNERKACIHLPASKQRAGLSQRSSGRLTAWLRGVASTFGDGLRICAAATCTFSRARPSRPRLFSWSTPREPLLMRSWARVAACPTCPQLMSPASWLAALRGEQGWHNASRPRSEGTGDTTPQKTTCEQLQRHMRRLYPVFGTLAG
jgi:hypothetical protein